MKNKNIVSEKDVTVQGQTVTVYRIPNDVNGNPRYVIHFLDLGINLSDYGKIPGLTKYRAKWFGGGYVFQSYDIDNDIEYAYQLVREFYEEKES